MRRLLTIGLTVVAALALPAASLAQTAAPLVTDRPDATESALVVPLRTIQVETGVHWDRDDTGDVAAHALSVPNLLLRLAVSSRVELRFGMEGLVRHNAGPQPGPWHSAASDAEIGAKLQLTREARFGLDTALIAFVSLPIGDDRSSGRVDPAALLAWGRGLGAWSISGNAGAASVTNERRQRQRELMVSVSLGRELRGPWGGFAEGVMTAIAEAGDEWQARTGLTRALGARRQADVYVSRGLSDAAAGWGAGIGFSVRFHR